MKKFIKIIKLFCLVSALSSAYATTPELTALLDSESEEDITSISENNDLDKPFIISRTFKNFDKVVDVITKQNYNVELKSRSATLIPNSGIKIIASSSFRDFLNKVSNQFGYSWQLSNNNSIIFKAIKPLTLSKNNPNGENNINSEVAPTIWALNIEDKTIRTGLEKWAKRAGWQLVWKTKYDMPIEASVSITGTFEYAINEICRASLATGKQLLVEMHDKNKVIIVYTPNDLP